MEWSGVEMLARGPILFSLRVDDLLPLSSWLR